MNLLIHILNILFAIPSFIFHDSVGLKKYNLSEYASKLIRHLPVLVVIATNISLGYFFFSYSLKSFEWITTFLLAYITLHYLKLGKQKKLHALYTENLQIAKDHAEIEALKLQLDPHFLFNSLNTLHHLIKPENAEARKYVQLLADVYRYILKNKTKELVLLKEELSFSEQYFNLLSIRYGEAIYFNIQIDSVKADDYLLVPISIQILIENAIKHNHFSAKEPLEIIINMDKDYVTVENNVRGINKNNSLKIGLRNLSERSLIITNRPLIISSSEAEFIVRIPLIKYK